MELLLSDYFIDHISIDVEVNRYALNLWVWHADKIPPHIGISIEGKYFSLKANGKDENMSIDKVTDLITKKKITALCFELNNSVQYKDMETCFANYELTVPNKITCLHPIKEILGCEKVRKLTELLTELYQHQNVERVIGFNTGEGFSGIKNYSTKDIHSRLKKLSNG
ncbi:MAG: hypothetical protein QNK23_18695 [Crocinitomicaceae bacterium]|nr:hypothetical protein [Crocinitomicaceae bacterium]